MENEKVKKIKKGLEFMMKLDLSNKLPYIDGYTPKQIAYEEIFNYINELESENERYKQYCGAIGQNSLTIINQLEDRIAELEKGNEALSFAVKQGFNDCQHKTLQEFAHELKNQAYEMFEGSNVIDLEDVYATLHKFIEKGDNNG